MDKFFGEFQALKGIDMRIGRQEVVVVIGPSGGGKSTLIRCINRLEHDSGRVVDGIDLSDDVRNIQEVRRETGMVFQQFNLFPHLTVLDNVTLAPRQVRKLPKKEAEDLAMQMLTRVKIPEQARKYPGQLSGGQQQGLPSPVPWPCNPRSCSSTSRPRPSTRDDQRSSRRHGRAGQWDDDDRGHREMGFARAVANRVVFMADGRSSKSVPQSTSSPTLRRSGPSSS